MVEARLESVDGALDDPGASDWPSETAPAPLGAATSSEATNIVTDGANSQIRAARRN